MMIVENIKYRNLFFYAACTESLKHGILHGLWVDPTLEIDQIKMDIACMLEESLYASETTWCITCFESPINFRFLDSQTTITQLHDMACFIEKYNADDLGAKLLDYHQGDVGEACESIEKFEVGQFESTHDFVKQYLRSQGKIPQSVINAVNTEKLWQHWQRDRFFMIRILDGVKIFRKTAQPVALH